MHTVRARIKFSRQVGSVYFKSGVEVDVTCPPKAVFAIISYNNGDITVRVPAKDLKLYLERIVPVELTEALEKVAKRKKKIA